jgi:N-acetylglucosaminyldiphosphoundecaprenol N-acetyl-beta-D-mannosaminyltransferase
MALVAVLLAAASILGWAVYARNASLLTATALFVVVSYILGPPFWSARWGPLTLNVERCALGVLLATLLVQWMRGGVQWRQMVRADWALLLLLGYLTLRCLTTSEPDHLRESVGPWWRLVSSFWIPGAVYLLARSAPLHAAVWERMLLLLIALGGYLTWTAVAEVTGQWWAVFPRYIADPSIGTHFGRARGPAVMSASLGIYLTICFWASWVLWFRVRTLARLALGALMLAMCVGIFLTYTRSTWLGLAGGLAVVPLIQVDRRYRPALLVTLLVAGSLGLVAVGGKLTSLGRHDSNGSAEHSVYQRASFGYVSLQMFKDAPIFGHGFGRFYDKKLPYLSDRRQQIELESIRELDHHITPLSLLTETGLVGLLLYLGLLIAWARAALKLALHSDPGSWQQSQGLLSVGTWIAYVVSALFHDLTLSPTEHAILFLHAGMTVGLLASPLAVAALAPPVWISRVVSLTGRRRVGPSAISSQSATRISLVGLQIDVVDMQQAVARVMAWCRQPDIPACRYVVTPNIDHAVMYQSDEGLRQAYRDASLVVADGAPIVWASRLVGKCLPERVAGSDLVPALFERARLDAARGAAPLRVFLLGAAPGVADRAARRIEKRWPGVNVVGTLSPPLGFHKQPAENARIEAAVAEASPDLLLLGLGAPKQEVWIQRHAPRLRARAALCVGATIDFLAGEKQRAPLWMQNLGLEWLHRLSTEPRRLGARYLRDAWVFPRLVLRDVCTMAREACC